MEVSGSTKPYLYPVDSLKNNELIMKRHSFLYKCTLLLEQSWHLRHKTKLKLHQMDVKTTFLNGVIEEEVYIEQPQGFEVEYKRTHVCKVEKDLYGLKLSPILVWKNQ